jgi:hypothetical protein
MDSGVFKGGRELEGLEGLEGWRLGGSKSLHAQFQAVITERSIAFYQQNNPPIPNEDCCQHGAHGGSASQKLGICKSIFNLSLDLDRHSANSES